MVVGMGERVKRITSEVSKYDRRLFAVRGANGMIRILRQADRLEASDFNLSVPDLARLNPQLVLCITDTWRPDGTPVDWGLEPIMAMIRGKDSWSSGYSYQGMCKRREDEEADKKRIRKNELRAAAADARQDFAKATNDINTAGMGRL